jgi:hypothetical protein
MVPPNAGNRNRIVIDWDDDLDAGENHKPPPSPSAAKWIGKRQSSAAGSKKECAGFLYPRIGTRASQTALASKIISPENFAQLSAATPSIRPHSIKEVSALILMGEFVGLEGSV